MCSLLALKSIVVILLLLITASANAQEDSVALMPAFTKQQATADTLILRENDMDIDPGRLAASIAVVGSSIVGVHIIQYNSWWKDQRTDFHLYDDPDYEKNFDKFGHAFGGYVTSFFFDEAYTWAGFNKQQSVLLGAASSLLFELYVEIEDGHARDWGFSQGDMKANMAGSAFYVLRNTIPFMKNFDYKWSYIPAPKNSDPNAHEVNIIDDYQGQSYWVTANINGLLPRSMQGVVPEWLNLAFGVGGYSLDAPTVPGDDPYKDRKIAYFIGIDYDMEKIIPESSIGFLNFIRRGLKYIHFPAPAYRITPEPRFFILFPFKMSIG
jgi:hypothetical protein